LLEILEREGSILLEPAAAELDVSVMTVRRDIQDLDTDGLVRRVRGGAVAPVLPRAFVERATTRSSAKTAIARKALALVPTAGAISVDASSTSGALLAVLAGEDLLVATNSIDNAAIARRRPGVRAVLIGGELEPRTGSLVGPTADLAARSMNYDCFFTSASAVDPGRGTSEVSIDEAGVKRALAAHAAQTVLLADASKLGQQAVARALEWESVDVLVTDLDPLDDRLEPYRGLVEIL
jgi:DeoR/GlpR family transcriptional regulator of sugar metabolism